MKIVNLKQYLEKLLCKQLTKQQYIILKRFIKKETERRVRKHFEEEYKELQNKLEFELNSEQIENINKYIKKSSYEIIETYFD